MTGIAGEYEDAYASWLMQEGQLMLKQSDPLYPAASPSSSGHGAA